MFSSFAPLFAYLTPLFGILGLVIAYKMYADLKLLPDGNDKMREIGLAIRTGAFSYLRAQATYLIPFVAVVFILIFTTLGQWTAIAYLAGSMSSLLAGFLGMSAATICNVRTAQAASENRPDQALMIAFNGGAVMGMTVAGLGLLGLGVLFIYFGSPAGIDSIIGFGVGASSVALFARVGGGIYTKAADVGADLVGKLEAGIPEDDPRNPGVIADNVGDNVGDVAGMGADIFESFVSCTIACMALGASVSIAQLSHFTNFVQGELSGAALADSVKLYKVWLMITPIVLCVLGTIASWLAIQAMKQFKNDDPERALRKMPIISGLLLLAFSFVYFFLMPVKFSLWFGVVAGALCGVGIGLVTEMYTAGKPVFRIVDGARTGPATCIIAGISVGFTSCAMPLALIVLATFVANYFGGLYGVGLAGVAMLSTVAITMTIDAYGPIADNAGGISEMAGLGKETRAITDRLDTIGNTTAAIGKGFAIGSAGLTALSLFGAYSQILIERHAAVDLSLTNANLIMGVFLGAILPGLMVAFTMSSVGRAAGLMVAEIRRQFREIPGLLEGKEGVKPDVSRCVEISTKAALNEMITPGVIAVTTPVLVGLLFGPDTLAGMLLGTTVVGVVLGIFMANTGGAWDNAKKFIEQGRVPGEAKGSDAHKAAVVGDTVGDPFKDTSGPALNILLKMVSVLALLIAPLLLDPNARYYGLGLLVLFVGGFAIARMRVTARAQAVAQA
jgi:K(+)-stimulated pyrophosphate-energized sodium pump